jgi:site-specific DNA-methyltransferase (adenine-specific)
VIWWKGRAAGGSCAWGTFQRPSNPVLRDVTERVIIASKGRFDRAKTPKQRLKDDLPSTATISRDEFLEATTDLWEIPPASATRVGHPAPFPVELPQRLIELYTYQGDLVLDPFMGAGTTGVAAVRTDRHYVGFETDQSYLDRAADRIDEERARLSELVRQGDAGERVGEYRVELPAVEPSIPNPVGRGNGDGDADRSDASPDSGPDSGRHFQAQAVREGRQAKYLAEQLLVEVGFGNVRADVKLRRPGVEVGFVATDQTGTEWVFDVSGAFTSSQAGLKRADTLWKAIGKASVIHQSANGDGPPLVLLTSHAPTAGSAGAKALAAVTGGDKPIHDVIELLDPEHHDRLRAYAQQGPADDAH